MSYPIRPIVDDLDEWMLCMGGNDLVPSFVAARVTGGKITTMTTVEEIEVVNNAAFYAMYGKQNRCNEFQMEHVSKVTIAPFFFLVGAKPINTITCDFKGLAIRQDVMVGGGNTVGETYLSWPEEIRKEVCRNYGIKKGGSSFNGNYFEKEKLALMTESFFRYVKEIISNVFMLQSGKEHEVVVEGWSGPVTCEDFPKLVFPFPKSRNAREISKSIACKHFRDGSQVILTTDLFVEKFYNRDDNDHCAISFDPINERYEYVRVSHPWRTIPVSIFLNSDFSPQCEARVYERLITEYPSHESDTLEVRRANGLMIHLFAHQIRNIQCEEDYDIIGYFDEQEVYDGSLKDIPSCVRMTSIEFKVTQDLLYVDISYIEYPSSKYYCAFRKAARRLEDVCDAGFDVVSSSPWYDAICLVMKNRDEYHTVYADPTLGVLGHYFSRDPRNNNDIMSKMSYVYVDPDIPDYKAEVERVFLLLYARLPPEALVLSRVIPADFYDTDEEEDATKQLVMTMPSVDDIEDADEYWALISQVCNMVKDYRRWYDCLEFRDQKGQSVVRIEWAPFLQQFER